MDLQEGRDRRLQIGHDLAADGNQVPLARQHVHVLPRWPGRARAERTRFLGPASHEAHSDATKACDTPSCSRSRCMTSVACAELAKCPTCTRYHVSPSRSTRTTEAS